jgi:ABC-type Fe3+/spermidine/putrescine transport system ATPase subunit
MIRIENLQVDLGDFHLKDINLEVAENEYFIILGPTAAGKTVLLESIAGLNPLKNGRIFIGQRDITSLSPEKRGVSLVYQDHALFPHLSVKNNITYGLRLQKSPAAQIQATLDWLNGLLNISYLFDRRPNSLSGGERQKVALARALSIKPAILLLDEPLSALDPETRENVQRELKSVHRAFKSTIIHVTHDFEEAMSLGTRIAVIGEGRIQQTGSPEEVFRHPQSRFVAAFTLMRNIFEGELVRESQQLCFKTAGITLEIAAGPFALKECCAAIRPEDIQIYRETPLSPISNLFQAVLTGIVDRGATLTLTLKGEIEVQCLVTRRQFHEMCLQPGDNVWLSLNPEFIHIFPG